MSDLIYKPEEYEPKAQKATLGVKFSNNIHLLKSFLDQQNIPYEESELEMTPLGLAKVIRR